MSNHPTVLERAFQLARSGRCISVEEIKKRLSSEGYFTEQIDGKALLNQLRALIVAARASCAARETRAE
jgi:hypothetical protein